MHSSDSGTKSDFRETDATCWSVRRPIRSFIHSWIHSIIHSSVYSFAFTVVKTWIRLLSV